MTRIDVAEKALAGIFEMERAAGRDAGHLGTALRLVVGAWMGHGFSAVLNDLEVVANIQGFVPLQQRHLNDLKASGRERMPHIQIERTKREFARYAEYTQEGMEPVLTQMDQVRR